MIKEYDVIYAKHDLSEKIKCGTKGVVLLILNASPYKYEVEFVDKNNDFLELMTVDESDIDLSL